ncbi:MAG TPA: ornithine cyclodeaminase family protein [Vicinamibacterales bacterium]|jgi:ornithine cyclodeaminase/alanine dehydrogenase-like protein (mu-crystallin family)
MLLLTERDVRLLLSMDDLIDTMHAALSEFSSARVQQPLRTVLEIGEHHAFFGVMPAYIPKSGALGTKLVTVYHGNLAVGLPSHLATIVLLDSTTGELLSIMDGRYITEARTAAVSAVSARLLAREDAGVLAIVGSGVQARSHLRAFSRVRTLRDVRVWSPREGRRAAFAQEMGHEVGAPIRPVRSAKEAVAGADLVVLATSSREPVVESDWIADGAHIAAVGACRPDQREMDAALVGRARVFVDSRTGALAEAGDLVLAIRDGTFDAQRIAGEIGELAAGAVPGRRTAGDVTLFKSLGMAVEDVAAAHLAFLRATERGLGRGIPM